MLDRSAPSGLAGPEPDRHAFLHKAGLDVSRVNAIAASAGRLGYEIVDVSGFLDGLSAASERQLRILRETLDGVAKVADATETARDAAAANVEAAELALGLVDQSADAVRQSTARSTGVAGWVASVAAQIDSLTGSLSEVQQNNALIGDIAKQVNLLSINARIEASRAGQAGLGFAVIASTVNELSIKTNEVAGRIRDSIERLNAAFGELARQSGSVRGDAEKVIADGQQTDVALGEIATRIRALHAQSVQISDQTCLARDSTRAFAPAFRSVCDSIEDTAEKIGGVTERTHGLIDGSEAIVQAMVSLGGHTGDTPFIQRVQADAARLSQLLEEAVATGRASMAQLFSREYRSIPHSRPAQVLAPFTTLTDKLFPPVQEAALELSDKVVFCVAVNLDGYLPTHNLKFSQPQGDDEAWNTANCRNRRIFDDRVGLKAGRNTQPFLLQVYRRDMGNGVFKLMKDVSSPIVVNGRHWGGLRLAYNA